jgi:nitrile hydratase accessory protein
VTATDPKAQRWTTEAVPSLARDESGPVFRESWEAQAFALTLTLQERGVFTWSEWTSSLAKKIPRAQSAGDPDTGETYYHHWLAALEQIVVAKGLTTSAMLTRYHVHGTQRQAGPAWKADRTRLARLSAIASDECGAGRIPRLRLRAL